MALKERNTKTLELEKLEPREQMLELAFNYHTMCTSSKRNNLYCIHSVISGLALEIIFKSFNSDITDVQTEHISKYAFNRSKVPHENHNLISLLGNVPPNVKAHLFSQSDIEIITKYQNVFCKDRYNYEREARTTFDNSFIKLVGRTILSMIQIYKSQGSDDGFITHIDEEQMAHYRRELYLL